MNFNELINQTNYKKLTASIESDLVDLFLRKYGDDEIEDLDQHSVYSTLDYDGSLHELIDGMIDIYYHDLRKWAVDNYNYVDEAIEQGLCGEEADYHQQIQSGQYVFYSEQYNRELEELVDEVNALVENQVAVFEELEA